jgi:hypothetical protein
LINFDACLSCRLRLHRLRNAQVQSADIWENTHSHLHRRLVGAALS